MFKEHLEVIYPENKDKNNLKFIKKILKNNKVLQLQQPFKNILEDLQLDIDQKSYIELLLKFKDISEWFG